MKTMHNYPVKPHTTWQVIHVPDDAEFVCIGDTFQGYRVWFFVTPDNPVVPHRIAVIGTGWPVPDGAKYVHTDIGDDGFVWHLFVPIEEKLS